MTWYSAMLRSVVVTADPSTAETVKTLIVFAAEDRRDALAKALQLGRRGEETYKNPYGELVVWRLVAIETLDDLGTTIEDGQEVHSEFTGSMRPGDPLTISDSIPPQCSEPDSTGV